jgi:tRNA A-37 threonylcarbamoyl transferase component Bud32
VPKPIPLRPLIYGHILALCTTILLIHLFRILNRLHRLSFQNSTSSLSLLQNTRKFLKVANILYNGTYKLIKTIRHESLEILQQVVRDIRNTVNDVDEKRLDDQERGAVAVQPSDDLEDHNNFLEQIQSGTVPGTEQASDTAAVEEHHRVVENVTIEERSSVQEIHPTSATTTVPAIGRVAEVRKVHRYHGSGGSCQVHSMTSNLVEGLFAEKKIMDEIRSRLAYKYPGAVENLRQEARIMKQLKHPHLPTLLKIVDDDNGVALDFTPVADLDLESYFSHCWNSDHYIDFKIRMMRWIGCLTDAVKHLHDLGILHNDLKPDNILICGENIFIIDFNVSVDVRKWPDQVIIGRSWGHSAIYCAREGDLTPQDIDLAFADVRHQLPCMILGVCLQISFRLASSSSRYLPSYATSLLKRCGIGARMNTIRDSTIFCMSLITWSCPLVWHRSRSSFI